MELLADCSVPELSTRAIATAVGISQPALFRHYDSRDAIVIAAVEQARDELAGLAASRINGAADPGQVLDALVVAVGDYAVQNPGMPRLLLLDASAHPASAPGLAMRRVMDEHVTRICALIAATQAAGRLPAGLDCGAAAALLLASVQGVLLQWLIAGRQMDPRPRLDAARAGWWAAARLGAPGRVDAIAKPAGADAAAPAADPAAPAGAEATAAARQGSPPPPNAPLLLDLRPLLQRGVDPLATVLAAVKDLPPGAPRVLLAPFRPLPLLHLLRGLGLEAECDEANPGLFVLTLYRPTAAR